MEIKLLFGLNLLTIFMMLITMFVLRAYMNEKRDRYKASSVNKRRLPKSIQRLAGKLSKPKGTILASPTPEDERKQKLREWEEKAYKPRAKILKKNEEIVEDFR